MLTPQEYRELTNTGLNVPDHVLQKTLASSVQLLEAVAGQPLYPQRDRLLTFRGVRDGEHTLLVGYNPHEILELKVGGQLITPHPTGEKSYVFEASRNQLIEVKLRLGFSTPPEQLKMLCALVTYIHLQETGYSTTETWGGLAHVAINSVDGQRNLTRENLRQLVWERLEGYRAVGDTCLM